MDQTRRRPMSEPATPPTSPDTARRVRADLAALADPERAAGLARYFKTGPGQYGEGDVFAGISMPQLRRVVRAHRDLPLAQVSDLLVDPVHEHRMVAVLLLAERYARADRAGAVDGCAEIVETLSGSYRLGEQLGSRRRLGRVRRRAVVALAGSRPVDVPG